MREPAVDLIWRRSLAALTAAIMVAGIWFRLTAYGDLRLSVATMDSDSYVQSSRLPLFSWASLIGERLFTTNTFYKLAGAQDCHVETVSIPAIGRESVRTLQACFSSIALGQSLLSVLASVILVGSFSTMLRHAVPRLVGVAVLIVFAFAPQVSDWDSVLSSESLTFSLFALAVGLGVLGLAQASRVGAAAGFPPRAAFTALGACLVFSLWILVRDANVYTALILCGIVLPAALVTKPRRLVLISVASAWLLVSLIALITAFQSSRWRIPLTNAFEEYVLPYPSRLATFEKYGMPSPRSPQYPGWFDRHGPSSYLLFLGTHPGFVATTLFDHLDSLVAENNQPYFKTPSMPLRNLAVRAGDLVHSKSTSVLLIDVVVVGVIVVLAVRSRRGHMLTSAGLVVWLLASAAATMALTFFADPIGVQRHVLFALFLFRLVGWIGILILCDQALDAGHERAAA